MSKPRVRTEVSIDVTVEALEEFIVANYRANPYAHEHPLPEDIRIIGAEYQPRTGSVRFYLHGDEAMMAAEGAEPMRVGTLDRVDLRTAAEESQNTDQTLRGGAAGSSQGS